MAQNNQNRDPEFQEEYKHISADIKKVIITNLIILILLLAAFFLNKNTGFLDKVLKLI